MSEDIGWAPGGLTAGSRLAGYLLEEQVGRGGMAVVYRAYDDRLDRRVALKVLAPDLARDEAFRRRFIQESRAAAAVDHPHIIPVFDAGEADGVLYLAMRYVPGGDVRMLLDRAAPLPAARACGLIWQVASALDAAHAHGLVHRDVKPTNMLLDIAPATSRPDHLYLSDFGLAKPSAATSGVTMTGQFLGTVDYVAPEQIQGRPVDGRADLYSLACASFEMLCGTPPFRREHSMAVLSAQLTDPPPSLVARRPELPAAVDTVMARALAKSPDDRYQHCLDFAEALLAACGFGGGAGVPGGVPAAGYQATQLAGPAAAGAGAGAASAGVPPPRQGSGQPSGQPGGYGTAPSQPGGYGTAPSQPGGYGTAPSQPGGYGTAPSQPGGYGTAPSQPGGYGGAGGAGTEFRQQAYQPGWWADASGQPPGGPGYGPAGPYPPGPPRRRRGRGLAFALLGVAVVLAGTAVAFVLLRGRPGHPQAGPTPPVTVPTSHSPSPAAPATPAPSLPPAPPGPAAAVRAYFRAINNQDYARAWDLGGRNTGSTYPAFVNGFQGTAHDTVTILSVAGNVVTARVTAQQTDGTVHLYQGTYQVTNGVITHFQVQQIS
jgi:tRNA A-37 threonylcarbamoyl transferase component Bud32